MDQRGCTSCCPHVTNKPRPHRAKIPLHEDAAVLDDGPQIPHTPLYPSTLTIACLHGGKTTPCSDVSACPSAACISSCGGVQNPGLRRVRLVNAPPNPDRGRGLLHRSTGTRAGGHSKVLTDPSRPNHGTRESVDVGRSERTHVTRAETRRPIPGLGSGSPLPEASSASRHPRPRGRNPTGLRPVPYTIPRALRGP